ncbi:hypothetical protein COOONC_26038, partial [Cooperia oncophora]
MQAIGAVFVLETPNPSQYLMMSGALYTYSCRGCIPMLSRDRPLYITADTMRDPIVVNAGRHGFFRQNYDEHGWRKIARQLMEDHR